MVVYGSSGAGKSSLAARIAAVIDAAHVEIDVLAYDEAAVRVEQSELRHRFATASRVERWVVEGMHRDQLTAAIPSADLLIWLDLPRRTIARRLVFRMISHLVTGRPRHGRRVTFRSVVGREVPFIVKSVRSVPRRRRHGRALNDLAKDAGVEVLHLTSASAAHRYLRGVEASRTRAP